MRGVAAKVSEQTLDTDDPTPLYHQLFILYRQRILTGALLHGERLPSEAELSEFHNVSRITAKRAMNELAQEGLVSRSRGKGTTVSHATPAKSYSADFSGLMENLVSIDARTTVTVLDFDYVTAPAAVAKALKLEAGAMVQRAERFRSAEGKPFSHILTYLPENIGRSFARKDLSAKPILSLIESSGHSIQSASQSITAVLADAKKARILDVPPGSALLKVTRVVCDDRDAPVQFIEVLYRPDVYQLSMNLARVFDQSKDTALWVAKPE